MTTVGVATQEERQKIITMYDDYLRRQRTINTSSRSDQEIVGSDIYVALTPGGGIPAKSALVPGSAVCKVWKIDPTDVTKPLVEGHLELTVYNISSTALPASTYILIFRSKYGRWISFGTEGQGPNDYIQVGSSNVTSLALDNSDRNVTFNFGSPSPMLEHNGGYFIRPVSIDGDYLIDVYAEVVIQTPPTTVSGIAKLILNYGVQTEIDSAFIQYTATSLPGWSVMLHTSRIVNIDTLTNDLYIEIGYDYFGISNDVSGYWKYVTLRATPVSII